MILRHFPKTKRDLLMLHASVNYDPYVSAFFDLSEPAKSTMQMLAFFII